MEAFLSAAITPKCYETFFIKMEFTDVHCLRTLLAKVLGYSIILGATIVKLPQIIKIATAKSAEGISFPSVLLELLTISIGAAYGVAYGYPFSSWGEALFLAIQTAMVGAMVLLFSGKTNYCFVFILAYCLLMGFMLSEWFPLKLLNAMQASNGFINFFAKAIQIKANHGNQSTGQISFITIFLLFAGSVARIFTSIQETGSDILVMMPYLSATLSNGIITGQVLYYWNSPANKSDVASPKKSAKREEKKTQ